MNKLVFWGMMLCVLSLNAQNTTFKINNNPLLGQEIERGYNIEETKDKNGKVIKDTIFKDYFKSKNWYKWTGKKKNVKKKNTTLKSKRIKIYEHDSGVKILQPEELKKLNDEVTNLENELNGNIKERDSLYDEYTKDYLNFRRVNIFNFGPVRSRVFYDILGENEGKRFRVLDNSGFSIGDQTGSVYTELVSGQLYIFKVSLGTLISSSSNEDDETAKEDEAFQRLVSSGGNTVLSFEYPLTYVHTRDNRYNFISRFIAKGAADFPEFGTNTEEFAGSASFGLDLYADASLDNNQLRFFGALNANLIYGNRIFRDNLNVDSTNFSFGQVTLGLVWNNNVKLSFVISTFSSEKNLQNRNVIAGGQILH